MRVSECGRFLSLASDSARIVIVEKTPLHVTAADNLGMVAAYLQDGNTFIDSGDWVNALAAFCYAYGWLHFGAATGYFEIPLTPCPLNTHFEQAPAHLCEKLLEKSTRYARLLNSGQKAVVPAPEKGTAMHTAADRVLAIISVYARQGQRFQKQGRAQDALACFSYGHGWLDAAVRAGIFTIQKDRGLFTI
jgi:hypothetical protein